MSDRENLEALKRMFENDIEKKAEENMDREKRFISDATNAMMGVGTQSTAIKEYDPQKMIAFLERPAKEIQLLMGGEWAEMSTDAFSMFVYSIEKKIKKSESLLDWKS